MTWDGNVARGTGQISGETGAFAALPESEAVSLLGGSAGAALHRLARGIDDRPVAEPGAAKQISAENTYEHDIVTLSQLVAFLSFQLRVVAGLTVLKGELA